ncbi:MAG: hypothetical protein WC997_02455 [Porticoccaceae bacterium]
MKQYLITVGDALSQLLNVIIFFGSDANESISGRAHRQRYHWFWGKFRKVIDWVFSWLGEAGHCESAYRADLSRAARLMQSHNK